MLPLLNAILPMLVGCASECDDGTRLDGTYAAWHALTNADAEGGTAVRDPAWPAYEAFVNGWTKWRLDWSGMGVVAVTITDAAERQGELVEGAVPQTFTGEMAASDDNCNVLRLTLSGDWDTPSGETLTFSYAADLTFVGEQLNGTFTYDDTMASTGAAGLTAARGEISAVLQADGEFDTGL
jgi:hypothetical protein